MQGPADERQTDKDTGDEGTSEHWAKMTKDKRTSGRVPKGRKYEGRNIHLIDGNICYFDVVETKY